MKNTKTLFLKPGERLVLGEQQDVIKTYMLPTVANADAFALLNDHQKERFEAKFCAVVNRSHDSIGVTCRSIESLAVPIPASTKNDIYPFSGNTFSFASFEFNEMDEEAYLAIFDKGEGAAPGFLVAEPFKKSTHHQIIHQSMLCKSPLLFKAIILII